MRLTRLKLGTLIIRSFLSIILKNLWTKSKYNNRQTVIIRRYYLLHFAQFLLLNMQLCKNILVVINSPAVLRLHGVFI
jgi:hypothetical protein